MIWISAGSPRGALVASLALAASLSGFGCSAADTSPTPAAVDEPVGSVGLALQVAGVTLNSVSYTIIGSAFNKSGTIAVTNSTRISPVIGGIPAGNGYSISLTASDLTSSSISCAGSASFNVTAGATTATQVALQC